jgi:ABC-type uncharacterized transport system substrate-binding protein
MLLLNAGPPCALLPLLEGTLLNTRSSNADKKTLFIRTLTPTMQATVLARRSLPRVFTADA